jgi:hypothetical protein
MYFGVPNAEMLETIDQTSHFEGTEAHVYSLDIIYKLLKCNGIFEHIVQETKSEGT